MSVPHKCPVCNGEGDVLDAMDNTSSNPRKVCPACNGVCVLWYEDRLEKRIPFYWARI
jgi:DnaJ-class molecular chaperone